MPTPNEPPPQRPQPPDPADCCGEGCAHCVFDIYEAALARYEEEVVASRRRQDVE